MRLIKYSKYSLLALSLIAVLSVSPTTNAAPVTSFGPGGFEDDNGADNLVLWFRSDKGLFQDLAGTTPATANGHPVARWNDQSGYGRNMTTFSGNPAPLLQLNQVNGTQSVIRFDNDTGGGLPSSLRTPSFTLNQPENVWSTHAFRGGDITNPTVWEGVGGGNSMRLYGLGGAASTSFNMHAGAGVTGATGAVNSFHNVGALYNGASSTFRTDGNQVGSGNVGANNSGGMSLGGGTTIGQAADADFSEVFVFNRVLNSTERIIVDNYQSARSAIPFAGAVSANDHYIGDNPGQGDFDFGVFGIGDDGTNEVDNAGMEGFGVDVAAGSLAGTNQWVFAGHADGPNGVTGPGPFGGGQRWERSWYLDATNITSANLAFDWNDAGNTSTFDPSFASLYFRSTNSGPYSLVATGTVDGINQRVDFSNIALQDGYYTLGSVTVPEPSTALLLGVGLLGMARRLRHRRCRA